MKHIRLRGAYLSLSGVTCRAAEVFDNVTTGVVGEYNTACRDALASRAIDSSSLNPRNDLLGGGGVDRAVDRKGDRDMNGRSYMSLL